jgi:sortase B
VRRSRIIILTLSLLCFLITSLLLIQHYTETIRAREEVKGLIQTVEQAEQVTPTACSAESPVPAVLPQYEALIEQNEDLIGWIEIEGTEINYPVMYTPDDGEFYLHRNFSQEYEYSGLPFLDKNCSLEPRSTNLIVYGHNMKNEYMFSNLLKYRDSSYYENHPKIHFDTLYEESEYEIIAVLLSQVYRKSDSVFKFYQFIDAETEQDFDEYIQKIQELCLYDTGVKVEFGDELLTLSTCSYHTENGRLAVIARKVSLD